MSAKLSGWFWLTAYLLRLSYSQTDDHPLATRIAAHHHLAFTIKKKSNSPIRAPRPTFVNRCIADRFAVLRSFLMAPAHGRRGGRWLMAVRKPVQTKDLIRSVRQLPAALPPGFLQSSRQQPPCCHRCRLAMCSECESSCCSPCFWIGGLLTAHHAGWA